MSDEPRAADGTLDPDASEEELGSEIESVVLAGGYKLDRVVGLGGSAGSIEALHTFLEAMPGDSGMAFVVVLHLSPEHESLLSEVLQRHTGMPVTQAVDGEPVRPNHVYVIPPGKDISLTDGHLRLTELARERGRRLTVDVFFRSLADTHGPHSVAIVLSGGDGDGAIGIKRVKERGGLTIAQDPESAIQAGMPNSAIATNMVDWVLSVEDMPARLLDYHQREQRLRMPPESGPNPALPPNAGSGGDESVLRDVLTFLRARTGRDFSYYKRATIVRRVARRMQVNEVENLPAYLNFLRTHPGEAGALLQDLLISVTNFFRDRECFEALEKMIPSLFEHKTQADTVRVWVPACATGEEAYSIAMLLSEHAHTLEAPPALQIFATDLHEEVLNEARNGFYPSAISTDVSSERLRRFFIKEHKGYRVRRELREILLFAVHDLLKDSPFSRLDLVSCRNLLIYLNRDAQKRAFEIFHFALRHEGRLMLGNSESVEDGSHLFYPLDKKHRIYATRANARTILPVLNGPSTLARALARALAMREHVAPADALAKVGASPPGNAPLATRAAAPDRLSWSELHLKLLERVGPPSLLVDDEHEILHLSEGVAPFLQFAGGEPSRNLLRVIHPALRLEVRAALFRARQTGEAAAAESVPFTLGDIERVVDIRVSLAAEFTTAFLLVTFQARVKGAGPQPAPRPDEEPALRQFEREIEQTKSNLRDIVEQHEASTEELKASNEELQAMNEELRSATEELETSREELQSINEELTTVNHELKAKIDELGQTNSDLHNLMGATKIATIFLDRELRIMRFTPEAVELFNLIPTDLGRPLAHLQHRLTYDDLLRDADSVLQTLAPIEREVAEGGGRQLLARMLPYRTVDDRIAGVVLTFMDVTERHAAQRALMAVQQELEQRVVQRTSQLDRANSELRLEVTRHQKAESARQRLQRLLVDAQEKERARISRELHDEVGQQISALMLSLKALESAPSDEALSKLRDLRSTTEQVAREIHQIAFELRPVALDSLGLVRTLRGFLEGWGQRTGLTVDFVAAGMEEHRLPLLIETTIYRVVQEAINNIYKHAHAKNVSVSVTRGEKQVTAIIDDDGVSFDTSSLEDFAAHARIGIAGMRDRATILGGELSIESSPGSGTTVRVRLPLPAFESA